MFKSLFPIAIVFLIMYMVSGLTVQKSNILETKNAFNKEIYSHVIKRSKASNARLRGFKVFLVKNVMDMANDIQELENSRREKYEMELSIENQKKIKLNNELKTKHNRKYNFLNDFFTARFL